MTRFQKVDIINVALIALILYFTLPLFFSGVFVDETHTPKMFFALMVGGALAGGIVIFFLFTKNRPEIKLSLPDVFVLLYAAYVLFYSWIDPDTAILENSSIYLLILVILYFFVRQVFSPQALHFGKRF